MKILVIGGYGFLGSSFIRHMIEKYPQDQLINLDKYNLTSLPQYLTGIDKKDQYFYVQGDICNYQVLDLIASEGLDCIVNYALDHDELGKDPYKSQLNTDIFGTYQILRLIKQYKIKKYIHISSTQVYGDVYQQAWTSESDEVFPDNPVAASKAASELLCQAFYKDTNLPIIIARIGECFGMHQSPNQGIAKIATDIILGKVVPDSVNQDNLSCLYSSDQAAAIDLLIHRGAPGQIYNIGNQELIPINQIVNFIKKHLNSKKVKDNSNQFMIKFNLVFPDCTKIRDLGWNPKTSFFKDLVETIDWYQHNQNSWSLLKKI